MKLIIENTYLNSIEHIQNENLYSMDSSYSSSLSLIFLSLFLASVDISSSHLLRSKMLLLFAVRSMSPSPKLSIDLRKPSAATVR